MFASIKQLAQKCAKSTTVENKYMNNKKKEYYYGAVVCLGDFFHSDAMKIPKHMLAMTAIFKLNHDSIEQPSDTHARSSVRVRQALTK